MDFLLSIISSIGSFFIAITFPQSIWIFSMAMILFYLWRVQASGKLDLVDMVTKNGTSVSLTKVLQLLGGVTATWVIMNLTMSNEL